MEVMQFPSDEWKKVSKGAHAYAFKERIEDDIETIDFALMAIRDSEPQCYCTVIEVDKYTCYMQHGGVLPGGRGTINTAKGYYRMVQWLADKYDMVKTNIKNDNKPMIKLALEAGFLINGVEAHKDGVFLSLVKHKEG